MTTITPIRSPPAAGLRLFLKANDLARDYHEMKARGVKFHGEPRQESYGKVVVFEDLYGNKWDLVEYKESDTGE